MYRRFLFCILIILLMSVPAAGVNLYPYPNASLELAAAKMKEKDYKAAREAALRAPQGGARDFLAGMSAARLARWEEAAELLGRASGTFPVLADYALYYQAQALYNLSRFAETNKPLQNLLKNYPESPLARNAQLLQADALFSGRNFREACDAYQKFIEKYPSGSDSLSALYKSAQCREELGDLNEAVVAFRNIWLAYPASGVADKAEADLQRLAAKGIVPAPYAAEELFKRGLILYDLHKYDKALKTFASIQTDAQSADLACKLALKTGQALFKTRRCKEAEKTLSAIDIGGVRKGVTEEALYWLARSLDKNGKDKEAVAAYLKLADTYPDHELADNALMEAAYVRKSQKRGADEIAILNRLIDRYPDSNLKPYALWEIAWNSYQARNYANAAGQFAKLTDIASFREKSLYWYARSLAGTGNAEAARNALSTLLKEYPFGFYANYYRTEAGIADSQLIPALPDQLQRPQIPAGFDRAKTLIAFGLYDEAKRELNIWRRKPTAKNGLLPGLAALYLEMNDYNSAFALFMRYSPSKPGKDDMQSWSFYYPLAFGDQVTAQAGRNGLPPGLVYSIIRAESNYSPTALSPAGAVGLMQLMPKTATAVAKGAAMTKDKLMQPAVNISLGAKHLKYLLTFYNNDAVSAIAAYNAGSANVNRWRKSFAGLQQDEFIESIPFGETREYVKKVLTSQAIYQRLYKFNGRSGAKSAEINHVETALPDLPLQANMAK